MSIIEDFLSKYTEIETFIRNKNQHTNNDKIDILEDRAIQKKLEIWKFYKSLRNLLTHQDCARNGKFINFTDEFYRTFASEVEKIMHPQKAIDIAIPLTKIYKVTEDQKINVVVQKMLDNNYTCTPIINKNGVVEGVFSSHSLMLYFNKHKQEIVEETANITIGDLVEFCGLQGDADIEYKFVSRTITVNEVMDLFEKDFNKNKRLEVIFITDNGKQSEKVLALLTHWDLNKRQE